MAIYEKPSGTFMELPDTPEMRAYGKKMGWKRKRKTETITPELDEATDDNSSNPSQADTE